MSPPTKPTEIEPDAHMPRPLYELQVIPTCEVDQFEMQATQRGEHVQKWTMPGTEGLMTGVKCFLTVEERDKANCYWHLRIPLPGPQR